MRFLDLDFHSVFRFIALRYYYDYVVLFVFFSISAQPSLLVRDAELLCDEIAHYKAEFTAATTAVEDQAIFSADPEVCR